VKYQVRLTASAEQDIDGDLQWFHKQSALAAGSRWFRQLMDRIDTLESHPERCPLAAESDDLGLEIHELHFGKRRGTYRVLFRLVGRTVFVLRIRHSARYAVTGDDIKIE
jgi:plasmid stabilization system protein ParE